MSDLAKEIQSIFSEDRGIVADDEYTRRTYGRDLWPRNLIIDREVEPRPAAVDAVVWPPGIDALAHLVRAANERGWELYPYGAGSGVCGGLTLEPSSAVIRKPRVVVDLKRMDKILEVDAVSQIAKVQAGIMGQVLEEDLNAKGYTMGHFPSSIYCSSFGGYLATRAAGQFSTYYGKIEDIVVAVEGVLPSGEVFSTVVAPRMAVGPDWNHFFLGSEGSLAFLTTAWVKVHCLPETRRFLSYRVSSTEKALEGMRRWLQAGLRPAVLRLYDEEESHLLHDLKEGTRLICVAEGEHALTDFTAHRMAEMATGFGGFVDTGEDPAEHWFSHRYDISYYQQQIMSHRRMILDTFEVATTWAQLPALHRAVKDVASRFSEGQGEMLIILAHFSHFYHTGGNIYFTLCGRAGEGTPTAEFYDKVWEALLSACQRVGAAISHHHGVGRLKARAHAMQQGPLFDLLKRLKNEIDPRHLLNPENMGL